MKRQLLYIIFGVSLCLISFSPVRSIDYRDVYCGTYYCNKNVTYLNGEMTQMLKSITATTITVTKNVRDSALNIITTEAAYVVKLKSNLLYPLDVKPKFYGKLINDSIYFYISYSKAPPYYKYIGKK